MQHLGSTRDGMPPSIDWNRFMLPLIELYHYRCTVVVLMATTFADHAQISHSTLIVHEN